MNINGGQPGCIPFSTGIFAYWTSYGIRDIIDGTSNTIAYGESLVGDAVVSNNTKRGNSVTGVTAAAPYDVQDATTLLGNGQLTLALQACNAAFASNTNVVNDGGVRWAWGAVGMTLFQTIVTPNSTQYRWNSCRSGCGGCSPDDSSYSNAQSNHSGGCNYLMGDGSVRFIKNTVSQQAYLAIGTRAGNEAVGSDAY